MDIILNSWIYPKYMKKSSYHDGEFAPDFPKDKIIEMIIDEMTSGQPIIWIRNQAMISKKSKYWFKEDGQLRDTDLDIFARHIHMIKKECILISSYGARPVPSSLKDETFNAIIDCKMITRWYTQNYDGTIVHPKLFPYPIGFPAATIWLHGNLKKTMELMLQMRNKYEGKKENKVFCDVHLLSRPGVGRERNVVKKELVGMQCSHLVILKERTSVIPEVYDLYSKYKFVVSTHGLGLDCHRTWEIFLLGGIVITKHSPMDYMYDDLPVIYVEDWSEILIKKNLNEWAKEVEHLTCKENIMPKMKRRYWIEEKEYNFNVK